MFNTRRWLSILSDKNEFPSWVSMVRFAFCKLIEKSFVYLQCLPRSLRAKWTVKLKTARGFPSGAGGKEPTAMQEM